MPISAVPRNYPLGRRHPLNGGVKSAPVIATLQQHIAFLDDQIAHLKRQIHDHFDHHPHLKHQRDLLGAIPGIGPDTAATLLAEVRDFLAFDNVRQPVPFAGLNPAHRQSGSSVRGKTRISKTGCSAIRATLYWPAISARRYNPLIRPLCDRLERDSHSKMVAITAAMRKLLHQAYGILKSDKPFDPDHLSNSCVVS